MSLLPGQLGAVVHHINHQWHITMKCCTAAAPAVVLTRNTMYPPLQSNALYMLSLRRHISPLPSPATTQVRVCHAKPAKAAPRHCLPHEVLTDTHAAEGRTRHHSWKPRRRGIYTASTHTRQNDHHVPHPHTRMCAHTTPHQARRYLHY